MRTLKSTSATIQNVLVQFAILQVVLVKMTVFLVIVHHVRVVFNLFVM